MLIKILAIHELLTKKKFEINLKKYNNVAFLDTFELDEIVINDSKLKCYVTYILAIICLI